MDSSGESTMDSSGDTPNPPRSTVDAPEEEDEKKIEISNGDDSNSNNNLRDSQNRADSKVSFAPEPIIYNQQEQAPPDENEISSDIVEEVVTKPPGGLYTKREYCFVLFAGVFMSFNSGYVNGSCLSGFVAPSGRRQAASSFTIVISQSALALADGDYDRFGFMTGMVVAFFFGACLSGILTPDPTPYRIEPTYGPTFLLGAAFLVASSILAAFERNEDWVFFLAAAANGIQNGVSSAYSENLIRSTGFTGPSSDISIYIAQLCRGDTTNFWRLTVLTSLLVSFWVGGVVSFYSAQRLTSFSLLINAGLFVIIGLSLVAFLVYELGISVKSAFLGTWQWKKAINELQSAFAESSAYFDGTEEEQLDEMFVRMDTERNGSIDAQELYIGLQSSGVNVTEKQCRLMIKHANKNSDTGRISRAEWLEVAQKTSRRLRKNGDGLSSRSVLFTKFPSSRSTNSSNRTNRTSVTSSLRGSTYSRTLQSLEEETLATSGRR